MTNHPQPGQRMPNGTVCQGNRGNGNPRRPSKLRRLARRAEARREAAAAMAAVYAAGA